MPAPDPMPGSGGRRVRGASNSGGGERRPGPELQAYVKAAIAVYKYPRRIEFLDALPKDGVGKIQRRRLREQLAADPAPAP